VVPAAVILDPEAAAFTPQRLWLSTGIRALDHAVEAVIFLLYQDVSDLKEVGDCENIHSLDCNMRQIFSDGINAVPCFC
jgi:alcohol dehydrogenase class IV